MRPLLITLGFIGAAALACGNPVPSCTPSSCDASPQTGCGCGCSGKTPLLETLTYAINELGLSDNGDIRTAIRLYKKEMRGDKGKIPMEAFEGGEFHPDIYAKNASPAQMLAAQSDLLETIYLVLNDEQKKEFPKLMGMYQHHMEYAALPNKLCATAQGQCQTNAAKCGTPPSKKVAQPLKR